MTAETTVRAALFDMEGTLVSFEWRLEEGEAELRRGYEALGFSPDAFAGESYSGMWNLALRTPEAPADEAVLHAALDAVYDAYDLDALSRWQLREGAAETLEALGRAGFHVGVVSNIGRRALGAAIEDLGIRPWFDLVLSRDDVRFMKPDGDGLRRALDILGVAPGEALFVGDSRTDVAAARDAGVAVAIIEGGESTREALAAAPPDHYLASLSEIMGLLGV
ncbi:MAG: HAD family hydrolase [Actinobacteria bacterium]|nr:HAD family hydrolase [Actinomycetota bacterium]